VEVRERQTIFAIYLKNSTIKFTILTEVDSQQQSFPLLSFKNVTLTFLQAINTETLIRRLSSLAKRAVCLTVLIGYRTEARALMLACLVM